MALFRRVLLLAAVCLALAPGIPALSVQAPPLPCDVEIGGWYKTTLVYEVAGVRDPHIGSYYAEYRWYKDSYPLPKCDQGSSVCEVRVWDAATLVSSVDPPGSPPSGSHFLVGLRSDHFPSLSDGAGWYKQIPLRPDISHLTLCSLPNTCGLSVSFVLIDGRSVLAEGPGCTPTAGGLVFGGPG